MNRKNRNIKGKKMTSPGNTKGKGFEDDTMTSISDEVLFGTISSYMKGVLDLEDIKNDPDLDGIKDSVNAMISDYHKNAPLKTENEKFIRDSLAGISEEENLYNEIREIREEIKESAIDDISAGWVREWHEKKQKSGETDRKSEEISNFIRESLNSAEPESNKEPLKTGIITTRKTLDRKHFIHYALLAAAVMTGAVLLVRTILPSGDPEEIFASYYKPFDAVSPVTRGVNNNENNIYSSAIEFYKAAEYNEAVKGFSETAAEDPANSAPLFFMGLTQLALGNYDQAIDHLNRVINISGEYGKEARWYLGLTYLRTGNKQRAAECFRYLGQTEGYYHDRSAEILRRLR